MTLIETIVWIAILTATMVALGSSLVYFYRTSRYAIEQASAVSSIQHGIDTIVRTLREASYSSNGAYPVISISQNQVSFYANVNHNDPLIQQVRFFIQGTSLMEGVIEPVGDPPAYTGTEVVSTLANYVQNLSIATTTFTYYDQNGAQISDYTKIGAVRFLTATIVADVNVNNMPNQLVLHSSAALRNLIGH